MYYIYMYYIYMYYIHVLHPCITYMYYIHVLHTCTTSSSDFKRPDGIPTPRAVSQELHALLHQNLYGNNNNKHARRQVVARVVTEDMLEKFEIRCKTNMSMQEIWNSRGE